MSERPIRVVCFDLGGVVVRICRTWEEACARVGVEVRDRSRFEAPELRARRHAITDAYMAGQVGCDEYCARIAEATGGLYSPDEVRAVHLAWTRGEYEGIGAVIDRLNRIPGITTACLSNTSHSHWISLETLGPIRSLSRRLASHHMGLLKPHAEIYRAAERELGAKPSEIVFFDDLEENIAGARACGWHAEQIDHDGDPAAQITAHLRGHGIEI